jgi:GTP-dependent phosphoenolpyruvate carboxykinase
MTITMESAQVRRKARATETSSQPPSVRQWIEECVTLCQPEKIHVSEADFDIVQSIDLEAFKAEILGQEELFLKLPGDLPKEMIFQKELLVSRL